MTVFQKELVEARRLEYSTELWYMYRTFIVWDDGSGPAPPGGRPMQPQIAVALTRDLKLSDSSVEIDPNPPVDRYLIATGQEMNDDGNFIAINAPSVETVEEGISGGVGYRVTWVYASSILGDPLLHKEIQTQWIDRYRVETANTALLYPGGTDTPQRGAPTDSYGTGGDIGGVPNDEFGSPMSAQHVTERITETWMVRMNSVKFDGTNFTGPGGWQETEQLLDQYILTRNCVEYRGRPAGTCLYLGNVTIPFGQDIAQVIHRIAYDPYFHLIQHAVKITSNGEPRLQTSMIDGRNYIDFAAPVCWVQPFPILTNWVDALTEYTFWNPPDAVITPPDCP